MKFDRTAGILLHPTSLPGFGGIGSLGVESYRFVDVLASARMGLWQVLPLGPTGYGDSPYSALAAFAGNPFLVGPEPLVEEGLLGESDLDPLRTLPETRVDFGRLVPAKWTVLRRSFEQLGESPRRRAMDEFREQNQGWLEETALFLALKDAHGGAPWNDWDAELRAREAGALKRARTRLQDDITFHCYVQSLFFEQWTALKRYANSSGIRIVGDVPIFVAYDSADVWGNQRLFRLDEHGAQTVLAGVPPDYFSPTGQLWGNPHYRWDVLEEEGFAWWIERFRAVLQQVDIIRLDHFRGFAGAWEVPSGEVTAVRGEWAPGPGNKLFEAVRQALGELPIIAEDLGVITPDVVELRDGLGFPGMHILQFAFGTGPSNSNLPHNLRQSSVVYTGTHDNDTSVAWFYSVPPEEQEFALRYLDGDGSDIAYDLIRLGMESVTDIFIAPLQDVLRLGAGARMNLPGRAEGNWAWRFAEGSITPEHVRNLRIMTETYGRVPERTEPLGEAV